MKKIVLSFLFALVIMILFNVSAIASEGTAELTLSKLEVKPGETFTATLNLASEDGISGVVGLKVTYDTEKLELVSKSTNENFINMGTGNTLDLITNVQEKIKSVDIYALVFKAKESITSQTTAAITATIDLIDTDAEENHEITVNAMNKEVTIKPESSQNKNTTNEITNGTTNDKAVNETTNETTNNIINNTTNESKNNTSNNAAKDEASKNNNTNNTALPYAGTTEYFIPVLAVLSVIGVIVFIKYKKIEV